MLKGRIINSLSTRAEEYATEEQAVAHVRRLLDIVACTTAFAKQKQQQQNSSSCAISATSESAPESPIPAISDKFDMAAIHPLPKLADFYDFFSFSHLTSPIICNHPCYTFPFAWRNYLRKGRGF